MFKFLGKYYVIPALPENLERLRELAYNIYWAWNADARELFRRLDRELWEETYHNPVLMLGNISQQRLQEVSQDAGFLSNLNRVYKKMENYLNEGTWYQKNFKNPENFNIVYFSAEFGLTECLQTYSGGLGLLAGDHLKAGSDLGIPIIGIGLLYKEGYFQQYLNSEGWQHEKYDINDFDNLPMSRVLNTRGETLKLSVQMVDRDVYYQVWKIQVGRVPLYLLDTNVPENSENDQIITQTLYGGDIETRIQQEIILGIGGIRTVHALGIKPMACHMNEGHSAFLSLERMRIIINIYGLTFKQAKEVGYYSNIFTTHTPVPAGIDVFPNELVEKYLGNYYRNELQISGDDFYKLGKIGKGNSIAFNMAHLAMNTAGSINGVSRLHGKVSRKMWDFGYENVPFNEIPIGYITNGVHMKSHISRDMEELLLQYIGEEWMVNPADKSLWERVDKIPDEELWRTHERRRERLVAFARRRLRKQIKNHGGSQSEVEKAGEVLDPNALTIGFARRFATYKRATLMFSDVERLADIVNNKQRPVQFIISGKAHPKDDEGKKFIQEIVEFAKQEHFRRKIVFIENYDINVAHYLVEGCDIWLNNPRRPYEASGTSGMKIIANGGLNFSVLDGWWDEGFDSELGWKIGSGEEYSDPDYQDEVESRQFYHTLENSIAPLFYERSHDGLPRGWITMVKNSMKNLGPIFNTHRMVQQYFEEYYQPALKKRFLLSEKNWQKVKLLADWKEKIKSTWSEIRLIKLNTFEFPKHIFVGEEFQITAVVELGSILPEDVEVQIYYGPVEKQNDPGNNSSVVLTPSRKKTDEGYYIYKGKIKSLTSGQQGYTIRVLPKHPLLLNPFELGVVYWAKGNE